MKDCIEMLSPLLNAMLAIKSGAVGAAGGYVLSKSAGGGWTDLSMLIMGGPAAVAGLAASVVTDDAMKQLAVAAGVGAATNMLLSGGGGLGDVKATAMMAGVCAGSVLVAQHVPPY